ncbi:MAG: amidohydrolase [Chloroflexota bacterium]|nr:amidohydrolase [Chloroflexota bacterium]
MNLQVQILRNAHIYTGCPTHLWATAIALVGERVAALDDEALAWADAPGATVEDLGGATVLPGLVDAHLHLMWYALSLRDLNLRDLSWEQCLQRVAERAAKTPPGAWIQGRGWDQNLWPGGIFPTAAALDDVAPRHPVVLIAKSAHAAVANSAALRLAGVTAETPDPQHGHLGRLSNGTPDGMLFEAALEIVLAAVPAPGVEEVAAALQVAQTHLLAVGITGIHDMDAAPAFAAYQTLHRRDELRVRVVKYVRLETLDAVLGAGLRSGLGDDRLRFGGLKLFADGALGARTAALCAPYAGEPDNTGVLTLEPEQLRGIARRAAEGGVTLAIHAIGDRANHLVLDVLEEVRPLDPTLRHRIEHVQLLAPEDVPRLARLGIVASMQPLHAPHDRAMAERYWGARTTRAYAWRSLLDAGTVLAFGSDAPVESFNPFLGLYAAVTRRHEIGGAPGPAGWHPEQRLALTEAVRAYTWGAAYAAGLESQLGTLAPGFLADLVVLDRDIFALPPEALLETRARRVMVGGVWA